VAINDAVDWGTDLGGGTRVALIQAGTFRSDAGALFGPVPRIMWDRYAGELQRHGVESVEREVKWLSELINAERREGPPPPAAATSADVAEGAGAAATGGIFGQ
jgi:hypothetical protein